jgi:hypothetical protein
VCDFQNDLIRFLGALQKSSNPHLKLLHDFEIFFAKLEKKLRRFESQAHNKFFVNKSWNFFKLF